MRKRPLVVIEWIDTCSHDGWRTEKFCIDNNKPSRCCSVGWLLKKSRDKVLITTMREIDDDGCNDRQSIPRKAVTSIRRLE